MGPNETSKLLHSKGNHKQDEKTTLRMGSLEKAHSQQRRPNAAKNKINKINL